MKKTILKENVLNLRSEKWTNWDLSDLLTQSKAMVNDRQVQYCEANWKKMKRKGKKEK